MWRRVSCEQLLDTSQSILRLRGNLVESAVFSHERPQSQPKGNEVLIPQPDSGTDQALLPSVSSVRVLPSTGSRLPPPEAATSAEHR